ncbi:hypothetical protein BRADI_5g25944v3, partial [Brachypodium distachyon]
FARSINRSNPPPGPPRSAPPSQAAALRLFPRGSRPFASAPPPLTPAAALPPSQSMRTRPPSPTSPRTPPFPPSQPAAPADLPSLPFFLLSQRNQVATATALLCFKLSVFLATLKFLLQHRSLASLESLIRFCASGL